MKGKTKALFIIPRSMRDKEDEIRSSLAEERLTVDFASQPEEVTRPEDYEILCPFGMDWVQDIIPKMNRLKWIHFLIAGVDRIWAWNLHKGDYIISKSAGVYAIPIAEHIIGMALYFTRKFHLYVPQQAEAHWERHQGDELYEKTMGIVGLGHIGRACARHAKCFGMRVLGTKGTPGPVAAVDAVLGPEGLPHLLQESDFLVLAIPATLLTRQLIGRREFSLMKKTAYLFNICRGSVVDEEALVKALRQGEIAGAGLDVFDEEPLPPSSPLWRMPNVLITPHVAGATARKLARATALFLENWRLYRQGKPLKTPVNLEKGY